MFITSHPNGELHTTLKDFFMMVGPSDCQAVSMDLVSALLAKHSQTDQIRDILFTVNLQNQFIARLYEVFTSLTPKN